MAAAAEPGPAVVLGLALFSAVETWRFSSLLCSAAYARVAVDRQPPVPVCPVVKGEAAPAPLPRLVVEAEAAPAALLLANAAGAPPLLAEKATGAPPLLAANATGAPPLLVVKAAEAPPLLSAKAAGAPPFLAAVGEPGGMLPLLVAAMETEPAGTLLLVEVGAASHPLTAVEVAPAATLHLLAEDWSDTQSSHSGGGGTNRYPPSAGGGGSDKQSSHGGGGGTSRYSPSAGGYLGCGHSAFPLLDCGRTDSPLLGCGRTDSPLFGCGRTDSPLWSGQIGSEFESAALRFSLLPEKDMQLLDLKLQCFLIKAIKDVVAERKYWQGWG
ncbi:UNVERIFIED_CONTAM: hypothetical protein FKN15_033101 [Acipenser sinensis]